MIRGQSVCSFDNISPDNLGNPALYINRELSWVRFNRRVLEEAFNNDLPLLERVKFLSIFSNNLDEFFMIRISGLYEQVKAGVSNVSPDGSRPFNQLKQIHHELLLDLQRQMHCWRREILPRLDAEGIVVRSVGRLKAHQRQYVRSYFEQEIFPTLTPLAFDPGHPFPHISNLSINLAVIVKDPVLGERFARLKVPDIFPRLLAIPDDERNGLSRSDVPDKNLFVWIEDVISANLDTLFPGIEVVAAYPFRITRDADLEIKDDEASDLLSVIQEHVEMRHFGSTVRLEIDKTMPARICEILLENLGLTSQQVYRLDGPIGMRDLSALASLDRPELKERPLHPVTPPNLTQEGELFSSIRRSDILLYHPYESFLPVVDFIREAAQDPQVLAIKQTLYRLGSNSPIVDALIEARENGKQVAVLVELKARFDEENNIGWAHALEKAGVHVAYGLIGLKTHAKLCLVIRREEQGITRYIHFGTGNYNPSTAKLYTDLSFFTCDPGLGADAVDLFNAITGYSRKDDYRKLWVAPFNLRKNVISLIKREIEHHKENGGGYLAFKMNSLVDPDCIQALYRASQAGVKIDLQVRGICCLRPGIPGISENITVTSIVGRFLEHARIYYFRNGGAEEVYLGSADLMPRNLDRRIEILFPIEDLQLKTGIIRDILQVHLRDTAKSYRLLPDGQYVRQHVPEGQALFNTQNWQLQRHGHIEPATRELEEALLQVAGAREANS